MGTSHLFSGWPPTREAQTCSKCGSGPTHRTKKHQTDLWPEPGSPGLQLALGAGQSLEMLPPLGQVVELVLVNAPFCDLSQATNSQIKCVRCKRNTGVIPRNSSKNKRSPGTQKQTSLTPHGMWIPLFPAQGSEGKPRFKLFTVGNQPQNR